MAVSFVSSVFSRSHKDSVKHPRKLIQFIDDSFVNLYLLSVYKTNQQVWFCDYITTQRVSNLNFQGFYFL